MMDAIKSKICLSTMIATLIVTMATDADTPEIDYNLSEATDAVSCIPVQAVLKIRFDCYIQLRTFEFPTRGKKCSGATLKVRWDGFGWKAA